MIVTQANDTNQFLTSVQLAGLFKKRATGVASTGDCARSNRKVTRRPTWSIRHDTRIQHANVRVGVGSRSSKRSGGSLGCSCTSAWGEVRLYVSKWISLLTTKCSGVFEIFITALAKWSMFFETESDNHHSLVRETRTKMAIPSGWVNRRRHVYTLEDIYCEHIKLLVNTNKWQRSIVCMQRCLGQIGASFCWVSCIECFKVASFSYLFYDLSSVDTLLAFLHMRTTYHCTFSRTT